MTLLRSSPRRAALALLAAAALALFAAACGGGDESSDADRPTASTTAPSAQEVMEQEFPDVDQQNAAAVVRRFYDVLGKTPKAETAGNGCIVDGKMHNAGDCNGVRLGEMGARICQIMSKQAVLENYRELYPQGLPPLRANRPLFVGGLDQTDDPKDANERFACLQGIAIVLGQIELDGGMEKAKTARIVDSEVKGRRGTVTVTFPNGKTTKIAVVREKGEWKFARLAGRVVDDGPGDGSPQQQKPLVPFPIVPSS